MDSYFLDTLSLDDLADEVIVAAERVYAEILMEEGALL